MAVDPPERGLEIDNVSFVVRAQKFRVAAMVMKRTPIAVATEYATRLVHLVQGGRLEDMAGFFNFDPAETKILLEDVLGTDLVREQNGQLALSQRGREALSPQTDTLNLFDVEEFVSTITLDLASFAPVEESKLNPREARVIEEIALPDREKAASAIAAARDAFELHFHELRIASGRRWLDDDTRLHSIDDVQPVAPLPAVFHIPVRWRSGDAPAVEADFAELAGKGRAGSRNALISCFSDRIKSFTGPSDHQDAYDVIAELDDGLFRRNGVRNAQDQAAWAALCENQHDQELRGADGPGLRLTGSTATSAVRSALLDWTQGVRGSPAATKTPVFWLPPRIPTWGRAIPFLNLASSLSTAHASDDGTVLFARCGSANDEEKLWRRLYGGANKLAPVYDRCLAVPATDLPDALEIVIKPGSWVMVLIHAPDSASGYPFPIGYITAARPFVDRFAYRIAELASRAAGTKAMLWTKEGEDAHIALARIDQALGIEDV